MNFDIVIAHINHAMNALRNEIVELEKYNGNKAKVKKLETQMNKLYSVLDTLQYRM